MNWGKVMAVVFAVVPLFLFSVYYFSCNSEMQAHLGSAIKAN